MDDLKPEYNTIMEWLPQRYPFLLVDCVIEVEEEYIRTRKCVSAGDYLKESGNYLIENMAQSASALFGYRNRNSNRIIENMYLAAIEEAEINRLPCVGEVIETEVNVVIAIGTLARVKAVSYGENHKKIGEAGLVLYIS